jgi:serine/threonine protein kinase/Tfp pilus assembly protein PilF
MPPLSAERWVVLSPYLDAALEMNEQEQQVWLSGLHGEDPSLANDLEVLLWKHRLLSKEGFLETDLAGEARWGLAGQTVGVYTLKSQIGQGGMGSVWLAERSDGRFERQVAVKFLNLALMGKSGEERFRREGRILALLDHPHIAKLVDAGVLPTGQPYLVLEHIEGDRIDRYCNQHRYEIKARCELFLDVLDAVARAHASLIVHRDIKPSNVLVRHDAQVKLLDFGIAKLLEAGEDDGVTQLTAEGVRAMTPECAAPEQLLGQPITTATDVYALGVLLFLLLTGEHPLGRDVHTAADLVKATLDTVPRRASEVALSGGGGTGAQNAADRNTTPPKLSRMLRGDLDTVMAKALKKEPAERYSSVTAMADDLRRHLTNEPIRAQADTFAYRARKFVRRNLTAVSLLALVVLTTAAGAVGTWMQARTARKQRDFAFHQLVRAQTTLAFNEFLLSDAAPSGKPFTVNELLGRAEDTLAHERGGDVDSRVELMVTIGDQYSTQDQPAKARRVLEEAYKLSRKLDDRSVRAQASCSLAGQLARDGDLNRAEALIEEGLSELPREPQYDQDRIFCLRRGSEVSQERGDAQQGIARIQETWEVLKHSPFDSPSLELHPLIELAEAYRVAGQNRLAESTFQQAAALLSTLGQDRTQGAVALFNDWAAALDKLGRPREAEKLYRRAIDISRTGPTEEAVSPMLLRNYAHTVRQLGRLDEAADYADRAYAKALQTDDQDTLTVDLYTRALIDLDRRDYQQASRTLAELQPRLRRTFPPDSYWFGVQASVEALLASARGDFGTAQTLADKAVAIAEAAKKAGRAGSDFLPTALLRRSEIELASSMPGPAEEDAQKALLILENDNGTGSPSSHVGHANLLRGSALQAQGKHAEAAAAFRSAADHLSTTLGADHRDTQGALKMADLEGKVR